MQEGRQAESCSAVNSHKAQQDSQQDTAENELFTPKRNHPTADVDRTTKQRTMTCSPDSVVRNPEVIYDDVPAENLQYPMPGTQPPHCTHLTVDYIVSIDRHIQ